jgi:hypothetical protein
LKSLLRKRQKKVYTLAVGKLNPAKLANYLEVECFVLVACPENSLVQNNKVNNDNLVEYCFFARLNMAVTLIGLSSSYHNSVRVRSGFRVPGMGRKLDA